MAVREVMRLFYLALSSLSFDALQVGSNRGKRFEKSRGGGSMTLRLLLHVVGGARGQGRPLFERARRLKRVVYRYPTVFARYNIFAQDCSGR